MRIEHKLSPTVVAYALRAVEQMNTARSRYLNLLGQAKEVEMQAEAIRAALQQQLAIVTETDRLPQSVTPYTLNAECTALVGEIPDAPPAAPRAAGPTVEIAGGDQHVNGAASDV